MEVVIYPKGDRISIHAAQEGCDNYRRRRGEKNGDFNPRSPRGLRLMATIGNALDVVISIHAAQEGCDFKFGFDTR